MLAGIAFAFTMFVDIKTSHSNLFFFGQVAHQGPML